MKVNELELSISLGGNQFITNWLNNPPKQDQAFIGTFVTYKMTRLCLEDFLSSKGQMKVTPSSLVAFFTLPETGFSETETIPSFLFETTSYLITDSKIDGSSEWIVSHFHNEDLIAQSYICYETELKIYRIIIVFNTNDKIKDYVYKQLKEALEKR